MDITANRLEAANNIVDELLCSKSHDFKSLKPSDLENGLPVVYAIFDKTNDVCLYVGRTRNLRRRLYTNHLMGPFSTARLKKYLVNAPERKDISTPEEAKKFLIDHCCFKYLAVEDMRMRGQIEGLLSYLLDVRFIHEEH